MVRKAAIPLAVAFSAILAVAASIDKRVVGGEDAKDGEFPSLVSIVGSSGWCGGSLVDSTTVVTAAHCLYGSSSVRAGSVNRREGGVEAKIASRKPHPEYDLNRGRTGPYANNDIGIIKLPTPIEESEMINYAKLPGSGSDPVANSTAITAGMGMQFSPQYVVIGDGGVDQLSKAVISVHTREECSKLDSDAAGRDKIVCAGGDGKNVCHTDSGGPLYDQETSQLIGITSWGIKDAEHYFCKMAPSVFTRVGSYISFIYEDLGAAELPAELPKSVDRQLQKHCGRFGNDQEREACRFAATRCTARVARDATIGEFLNCVDSAQVCADFQFAKQHGQCFDKAKTCKEENKLPLGELTELAKCAKDGISS